MLYRYHGTGNYRFPGLAPPERQLLAGRVHPIADHQTEYVHARNTIVPLCRGRGGGFKKYYYYFFFYYMILFQNCRPELPPLGECSVVVTGTR